MQFSGIQVNFWFSPKRPGSRISREDIEEIDFKLFNLIREFAKENDLCYEGESAFKHVNPQNQGTE